MIEKYLHEGEQLLVSRRAAVSILIMSILRGLVEAIVVTVVMGIISWAVAYFAFATSLSMWMFIALFVLILLIILLQRVRNWNEGRFRVTTERILVAKPTAFFHTPLITIKWPQYQECEVSHRSGLDIFFLARPLRIRYGTADARYEAHVPSLRYAEDLKHYLDKVDAAVRRSDTASLKPFVAKARGKRDEPA